MSRLYLLPYDEELFKLVNFTIYNTDTFERELILSGINYEISKEYSENSYTHQPKSKLRITDISSNSIGSRSNRGYETLTIIVERRKEERKEERRELFRNKLDINFEKHLFQGQSEKPNKPLLHSEELRIELGYLGEWDEKEQDIRILSLEEFRNNPILLFNHEQTISMPNVRGNTYRRINGYSDSSLSRINKGLVNKCEYLFEGDQIINPLGVTFPYSNDDSSTLDRLREDGLVIPALDFILSNPKYLKLYEYYYNFSKAHPHLNAEENLEVLEMIDIRNTLLGELNTGIGFTKENMESFISFINDKYPIEEISQNNAFVKKRSKP